MTNTTSEIFTEYAYSCPSCLNLVEICAFGEKCSKCGLSKENQDVLYLKVKITRKVNHE